MFSIFNAGYQEQRVTRCLNVLCVVVSLFRLYHFTHLYVGLFLLTLYTVSLSYSESNQTFYCHLSVCVAVVCGFYYVISLCHWCQSLPSWHSPWQTTKDTSLFGEISLCIGRNVQSQIFLAWNDMYIFLLCVHNGCFWIRWWTVAIFQRSKVSGVSRASKVTGLEQHFQSYYHMSVV